MDPAAFYIPKGSLYGWAHKCSVLQSTDLCCHKWKWKGPAACGHAVLSQELRPRSSNNLTHHIFFSRLASWPSQFFKTAKRKIRRALEMAQRSYKASSRAGSGQDGNKSQVQSSVATRSHLRSIYSFITRIQATGVRWWKRVLFVLLMTQLSKTQITCLTFPNTMWSKCAIWQGSSIIHQAQVHDCN